MTPNPLFSVLIANYNNGQYLQEAINSVIAQTYTNWEVIIVDDYSTDDSKEIYDKYQLDNRFHIYYNEENKGCGYTKRKCAELANGEICGFLDPDDALLPRSLALMVEVHIKYSKVSVVYSRCYLCNENYEPIGENRLLELKEGETYFDYRWYGAMHLATYKNAYYKKTEGISPVIKAGVDQDLYFKIEEVGSVYVLNEFTYKYVVKGHSHAITSDWSTLWYWNLRVRRDACVRRGLDSDLIISNDFMYLIKNHIDEVVSVEGLKIRTSYTYRLGYFLLYPIKKIKSIILNIKK